MLVQTSQLLVLWLSPTPWCFCGRKSAGMVLPDLHKQHCHLLLTSPVISPLFLMKERQVWVISLGMWPITVKLFLWCTATAYLSCSLSSSQNISSYSPTQGLHMHLYRWCHAFHYKLVSRSGGCTWSLCHVHVHRDVLTDIDWTFYWSLLTCIDRPIRFDTSQLKSYQVPKRENYTSNNDFPLV